MPLTDLTKRWRSALLRADVETMARRVRSHLPDGASRLLVGFSGGQDSTALALAVAAANRTRAEEVRLVHVNHQLQPEASGWVEHCRRLADAAGIELLVCEVDVIRDGEGLEAAARSARYAALEDLMRPGDVVLTAHHQRDQAETVLLRLLRGAGVDGLAAMRHCRAFGAGWLCRPLLDVAPDVMSNAVQSSDLPWIEDSSNADLRLDRVFMRERVLPLLRSRWSGTDQVLARTADRACEASTLVQSVASELLLEVAGRVPGTLSRSALAQLTLGSAKVVLRAWLKVHGEVVLGAGHTERLCRTLTDTSASMPSFATAGVDVRCYGDDVFIVPQGFARDASLPQPWTPGCTLHLSHGELRARQAQGAGLSRARIANKAVTVRYRRDGERMEFATDQRHRALKKQFQHWRIPPWQRDHFPLVCVNDEVVCVPGYTTTHSFAARAGEDGWLVSWEPLTRMANQ